VHGEGLQGVAIVGGDEDGRGHAVRADLADDVEPVAVRHLHVQEGDVGGLPAQHLRRRAAGGALADDHDVRFLRGQGAQALAGQGLVVGDEDARRVHQILQAAGRPALRPPTGGLGVRKGRLTDTSIPPSRARRSSNRCAVP
jgi:hypothetical protein